MSGDTCDDVAEVVESGCCSSGEGSAGLGWSLCTFGRSSGDRFIANLWSIGQGCMEKISVKNELNRDRGYFWRCQSASGPVRVR